MKTARKCLSSRLLPLLTLLGLLVPATRAAADSNLNNEMAEVAKHVKQVLDGKGATAIAVGAYTGPFWMPSNSGPAIAASLSDQLKALGVEVVKPSEAPFIIQGTYKLVEDANSKDGLHAVAVESTIVDKKGEEVVGRARMLPRGVYGDEANAVLLGLTYSQAPAGNFKARDTYVEQVYENPKSFLDKTLTKAGDSPFAVEIMVKDGEKFVPRAAADKDGLAYVELKKDDLYRVRVYNDSDYEVAAALFIDGLNIFQFSELRNPQKKERPLYDRVLVKAHGAYEFRGWFRHNEKNGADAFQATKDAAAAAPPPDLNTTSNGTITATFGAAWPKDGAPPPDEPKDPSSYSRCGEPGTQLGAETGDGYHEAERRFGVLRAAVSVRYNK